MSKKYYEELIERLKRTGNVYYPSHQADLYFEAASAISELIKKKGLFDGKRKLCRNECGRHSKKY